MTSEDAKLRPVFALESGPAAGVVAALGMAQRLGIENVIAFDMGGTTAKASLIENGAHRPRPRVRGRRLDLRGQPADPRRRRAAAHPDDRHRRGRRRRRQHRVARPGRRAPGRAAQRGRRSRARPATAAAASSRPSPTRTSCSATCPAGRVADGQITISSRARRGGGRAGRRAARALTLHEAARRHPPDRERAHDACAARGLVGEGPRPARLRDHRLRRLRAGACRRARRRPRRDARSLVPAGGRAVQRGRPALRAPRVPRGALVPPRRRRGRPRRDHGAARRDGGAARRTRSPGASETDVGADGRPPLRRAELGDRGRAAATARSTGRSLAGLRARFEDEHEVLYGVRGQPGSPVEVRAVRLAALGPSARDARASTSPTRSCRTATRRAASGSAATAGEVPVRARASIGADSESRARCSSTSTTRRSSSPPAGASGATSRPATLVLERERRRMSATARDAARPRHAADRRERARSRSPTRWRRRSSAPRTRPSSATAWTSPPRSATPRGETVAQAVSVPFHLGSIPTAMESLLARYGDRMRPGDVFIMNDPFDGGMHLQDIFVVKPVHLGRRADRLRRHDRAPRRRRRAPARLERVRQHGDLPGGPADAVAALLRRGRAGRGGAPS